MELPVHKFQLIKLIIHIVQLVFIFAAWILCITVFRSSGDVDGRLGWYFGLCFSTIVPIIYLTMTPRFPRTRRFANPYAMAVVDLLFAVMWISAFAAVANWNSTGKCKSGCGRSKAVVGLGVFIWLLWVLTTAMSIYSVLYYRREGYLPGGSRAPTTANMIDPDKEAFSTAPGVDEYAPVHNTDVHDQDEHYDSQPTHETARFDTQKYGYVLPRMQDENTQYMGYTGGASPAPGTAHFPGANYNV